MISCQTSLRGRVGDRLPRSVPFFERKRTALSFGQTVSLAVHALLAVAVVLLAGRTLGGFTSAYSPPELIAIDLPNVAVAPTAIDEPAAVAAAMPRPHLVPSEQRPATPAAPVTETMATATPAVAFVAADAPRQATLVAAASPTGKRAFEGASVALFESPATNAITGVPGGDAVEFGGAVALRHVVKPRYPAGAQQRGEEGQVVLEVVVAPDGSPSAVSVLASSGFGELDRAATKALERAAFHPAREGGRAVEARVRLTMIFRLTG